MEVFLNRCHNTLLCFCAFILDSVSVAAQKLLGISLVCYLGHQNSYLRHFDTYPVALAGCKAEGSTRPGLRESRQALSNISSTQQYIGPRSLPRTDTKPLTLSRHHRGALVEPARFSMIVQSRARVNTELQEGKKYKKRNIPNGRSVSHHQPILHIVKLNHHAFFRTLRPDLIASNIISRGMHHCVDLFRSTLTQSGSGK
jgi:hypothetical protein